MQVFSLHIDLQFCLEEKCQTIRLILFVCRKGKFLSKLLFILAFPGFRFLGDEMSIVLHPSKNRHATQLVSFCAGVKRSKTDSTAITPVLEENTPVLEEVSVRSSDTSE